MAKPSHRGDARGIVPDFRGTGFTRKIQGRCSKGVDPVLEGYSKLGALYEPLDPGPQVEVFARDFLRVLLANVRLLWGDVPLVRAPPSV